MSHDDATPTGTRHSGTMSLEERLERIEEALTGIKESIAGLPLRVRALEIVVYGGCGVALLSLLGAVVALVLKAHP